MYLENLDTESKVRDWISSHLRSDFDHLLEYCTFERIGDAWVVLPSEDQVGLSALIVASDGKVARAEISSQPVDSLFELVRSGAWIEENSLSPIYPERLERPSL